MVQVIPQDINPAVRIAQGLAPIGEMLQNLTQQRMSLNQQLQAQLAAQQQQRQMNLEAFRQAQLPEGSESLRSIIETQIALGQEPDLSKLLGPALLGGLRQKYQQPGQPQIPTGAPSGVPIQGGITTAAPPITQPGIIPQAGGVSAPISPIGAPTTAAREQAQPIVQPPIVPPSRKSLWGQMTPEDRIMIDYVDPTLGQSLREDEQRSLTQERRVREEEMARSGTLLAGNEGFLRSLNLDSPLYENVLRKTASKYADLPFEEAQDRFQKDAYNLSRYGNELENIRRNKPITRLDNIDDLVDFRKRWERSGFDKEALGEILTRDSYVSNPQVMSAIMYPLSDSSKESIKGVFDLGKYAKKKGLDLGAMETDDQWKFADAIKPLVVKLLNAGENPLSVENELNKKGYPRSMVAFSINDALANGEAELNQEQHQDIPNIGHSGKDLVRNRLGEQILSPVRNFLNLLINATGGQRE